MSKRYYWGITVKNSVATCTVASGFSDEVVSFTMHSSPTLPGVVNWVSVCDQAGDVVSSVSFTHLDVGFDKVGFELKPSGKEN